MDWRRANLVIWGDTQEKIPRICPCAHKVNLLLVGSLAHCYTAYMVTRHNGWHPHLSLYSHSAVICVYISNNSLRTWNRFVSMRNVPIHLSVKKKSEWMRVIRNNLLNIKGQRPFKTFSVIYGNCQWTLSDGNLVSSWSAGLCCKHWTVCAQWAPTAWLNITVTERSGQEPDRGDSGP